MADRIFLIALGAGLGAALVGLLMTAARVRRSWKRCGQRADAFFTALVAAGPAEPEAAVLKPRIRVLPGGWIRHNGGLMPDLPDGTMVDVCYQNGLVDEGKRFNSHAETWWKWTGGDPRWDIRFYRIGRVPAHRLGRAA